MNILNRKSIIDELEGSLTGSPIDATNHEVPTLDVEESYDENITAGSKVSKKNLVIRWKLILKKNKRQKNTK